MGKDLVSSWLEAWSGRVEGWFSLGFPRALPASAGNLKGRFFGRVALGGEAGEWDLYIRNDSNVGLHTGIRFQYRKISTYLGNMYLGLLTIHTLYISYISEKILQWPL